MSAQLFISPKPDSDSGELSRRGSILVHLQMFPVTRCGWNSSGFGSTVHHLVLSQPRVIVLIPQLIVLGLLLVICRGETSPLCLPALPSLHHLLHQPSQLRVIVLTCPALPAQPTLPACLVQPVLTARPTLPAYAGWRASCASSSTWPTSPSRTCPGS